MKRIVYFLIGAVLITLSSYVLNSYALEAEKGFGQSVRGEEASDVTSVKDKKKDEITGVLTPAEWIPYESENNPFKDNLPPNAEGPKEVNPPLGQPPLIPLNQPPAVQQGEVGLGKETLSAPSLELQAPEIVLPGGGKSPETDILKSLELQAPETVGPGKKIIPGEGDVILTPGETVVPEKGSLKSGSQKEQENKIKALSTSTGVKSNEILNLQAPETVGPNTNTKK